MKTVHGKLKVFTPKFGVKLKKKLVSHGVKKCDSCGRDAKWRTKDWAIVACDSCLIEFEKRLMKAGMEVKGFFVVFEPEAELPDPNFVLTSDFKFLMEQEKEREEKTSLYFKLRYGR